MRRLLNHGVMAMLILLASGEEGYATPPLTEEEQTGTLKSLEAIAQQVDDVPALLYLTPAQIDAVMPESRKTAGNKSALGEFPIVERGHLREFKLQQATINQLKSKIAQQNLVIRDLQSHDISLPENDIAYRDYAIGVSFGNSIASLLAEREKQGIKADKKMVIAGAEDAMQGKLKLSPSQVAKALQETEVAIRAHEEAVKSENVLSGVRYIEQFKGQPQVEQAPEGFYYRIDSSGKGEIKTTDTVTIVVKESLINGKIIKDMDASGMAMSQRLSAYPPLFKTALMQLQNHGSITVVVPPELAYGDKGLPPSIPPNSTMVYNIRVLDVLP